MMLGLLNVSYKQFTIWYSSGGLCKISIRIGLDLGRKTSIKILSAFMQQLGFQLYEIEFLSKQATDPPLGDRSNLASSLLKTVLPNLVPLDPVIVSSVSLAM